ncbi:MAG: ATP-dependent RNA helicase SrmB [Candidatus Anoxychlamydiales bacterium]|nr:ATP-dependent RNA helicase SrmB [Candidatus Anoxychlamydiales bacterium]
MNFSNLINKYKKEAIKNNAKEVVFSENIYEVEIVDSKNNKTYYPFLQIDDEKNIIDAFCTCSEQEKNNFCSHITTAYLFVTKNKEPLHVEFKKSFFYNIFKMISSHIGFDSKLLKKINENTYHFLNKTKKELFLIETKNKDSLKKLNEILNAIAIDAEKSLKFSAHSFEEIKKYKEGLATDTLKYELSFFSDLAKWFFNLYKTDKKAKIEFFDKKDQIFSKVLIDFKDIKAIIYIPFSSYKEIIPSFNTMQSNLKLFEYGKKEIESIYYDKKEKCFHIKTIEKKEFQEIPSFEGIKIDRWIYIEDKGFYPSKENELFLKEKIKPNEVSYFLNHYLDIFEKYLKNEKIITQANTYKYYLFFDSDNNLHIKKYVFDIADFENENSYIFNSFIYLDSYGFLKIEDDFFIGSEKIVKYEDVSNFVSKHRHRLHKFKGFETHFGTLESHLIYELTEKELIFSSKIEFDADFEEFIDFDGWIYIKGKGFYSKKEKKDVLPLRPGLRLQTEDISNFISAHIDELEFVDNFFTNENPIEKIGIEIKLTMDEKIIIKPQISLKKGYDIKDIILFSAYGYLKNKGFFKIEKYFLPKRYEREKTISKSQEVFFITYELDRLSPYIIELDNRLKKPKKINLKILKLQKKQKLNKQYFLANLVYKTDIGIISAKDIAKAIIEQKKYLFSKAGLIFLKKARFNYLRNLNKKQIYSTSELLKLSTLEWIRLLIFEDLKPFKGKSKEAQETKKILEEIRNFETDSLIDTSYLKAKLRPYQEIGVKWLWFLYCHNLSGMLCDDMGIGKTHQTMALIAALKKNGDYKYIVVCPTSVIYHWEDLIKKFLPSIKVYTYHGTNRDLKDFYENYDLLLTSYGLIRTDIKEIKKIKFEISIFDEMQIAKNASSITHKSLCQINSNMTLGLSGTPIENYLKELKALFDLVLPNYLPTQAQFKELFINPIEKANDKEAQKLLKKLIKPFILRRKKSEVLKDLPEKIEENIYFDLSNEQKKMYNEIIDQTKTTIDEFKNEKKPSYIHVFSILSKLKQICDHPSLINKDLKNYSKYKSGKFDLFEELLNEALESDQKVVIFSQYLGMIEIIEKYLKSKKINYASIKGSTKKRYLEIKKFKEDPSCKVFVASLLAAGVGIDLSNASIVIHYDRWWNPAKENQATDRVHRIGQNRGVQVFKLIAKNTIEERIHSIIEKKQSLIEDTIGFNEIDEIKRLTKEDLLAIFNKIY